jgi:hypothetical protein
MDSPSPLFARVLRARRSLLELSDEINRFLSGNGRPSVPADQSGKICFALMGQFNAGKSTLVNALLGRKVAETGASPTTRLARGYDLGDFHVLDLPGGGAREAEEREAEAALSQTHLVLYVALSSSGFDSRDLWADLGRLAERGIRFLVVINENTEPGLQESLLANFHSRAGEVLDLDDWEGKLFWVNAAAAEKARLATPPKRKLEAASGIVPLERQLFQALKGEFFHAIPRPEALVAALGEAEKVWAAQLKSRESERLAEALHLCQQTQDELAELADVIATEQLPHLRDGLLALLEKHLAGENQDELRRKAEEAKKEAGELIQRAFEAAVSAFDSRCLTRLQMLSARLGEAFPSSQAADGGRPRVSVSQFPQVERSPGASLGGLFQRLTEAAPLLSALLRTAGADAGPAAVVEATGQGAKTLAQQGGKQMAAMAGTVGREALEGGLGPLLAKAAAPVVLVCFAAFEVFTAVRKSAQEWEELQRAHRQALAEAERVTAEARNDFLAVAERAIADRLAPVIRQLRERLQAQGKQAGDLELSLAEATALRDRLKSLLAEFNAGSPA